MDDDHPHPLATLATFDPSTAPATTPAPRRQPPDRQLSILGVQVTDVTRRRAAELIETLIRTYDGRTRSVFYVNTHALNLAASDPAYRRVLNSADYVFGDGTGVRWAARLRGVRVRENLCGTDVTPLLLRITAHRGYRYFLLGGDAQTSYRAAQYAAANFTGWAQAGYHHGYLADERLHAQVIRQINESRPDLLLVGMGNPRQDQWIDANRHELNVPVCMAVGGLFHYWAGDLRRTPRWLRRCGAEWLGILCQQPRKAPRYLLGNPLFLLRILREKWSSAWKSATPAGT